MDGTSLGRAINGMIVTLAVLALIGGVIIGGIVVAVGFWLF